MIKTLIINLLINTFIHLKKKTHFNVMTFQHKYNVYNVLSINKFKKKTYDSYNDSFNCRNFFRM